MKRLVLATRNAHKRKEIGQLLAGSDLEVVACPDEQPETVEDRPTIEGNSEKKAGETSAFSKAWALADDTGLEVAALGGAPGVYSARYAGPGCSYADNNAKLLEALAGKKDRSARFRTVMTLCSPEGKFTAVEGVLDGEIAEAPRGSNGFGYDPVFVVKGLGKTLAELTDEEKNGLSHRGRALRAMAPLLKKLLILLLAACACLRPLPALASRTEPGQETIWDQIMASHSHRELREGAQYIDEHQYEAAAVELRRAVAANPRNASAHMLLGVAQYWLGEVDKSLESYKRSLELEPANAQGYMLTGISLAYKGRIEDAHAAFTKAAELDPHRADIQMNLGSVEESMNRALDALEHFRRAVRIQPTEALYHYQLGMLYRRLGRDAEAAASMKEALKQFPQFEDALIELGAIEERSGDRKAAMKAFKRAVELKSRDSVARLRLARLYLLEKEERKAREILSDAFHLTPEEGGAGLQLSVSYAGGKRPAEGRGKSGKPGEGKDAKDSKDAKGAGEPNDPLNVFKRNLERIPLDQSALMRVDVMFVPKPKLVQKGQGEVSTLAKALQREVGDKPQVKASRRDFRIDAGDAQARERQIAAVLDELGKVMAEAPAEADVRLGMNLNFTKSTKTSAVGRADAGTPPKVSYQPRQVGNDLGLWIIGTAWMQLVEEVLPEAGEKPHHPDEADWWVTTGLGFASVGDGQRALGAFERAGVLEPGNEAAWLGLGVSAVMTGDERAAESALEKALSVNPKSRAAADGLKWLRRPAAGKPGGK
jgi:XTP/dITP diphosphohydrolase